MNFFNSQSCDFCYILNGKPLGFHPSSRIYSLLIGCIINFRIRIFAKFPLVPINFS